MLRSSNLSRNTRRLKALVLQLSKEQPIFIPVFIQPYGNYSKDVIISMRTWFTGPAAQKQRFPMVSFIHPNHSKHHHYLINQLTVITYSKVNATTLNQNAKEMSFAEYTHQGGSKLNLSYLTFVMFQQEKTSRIWENSKSSHKLS